MKEPEKNVKLKNFGSFFHGEKICFKTLFCFSSVLMTKQLLKHDFDLPHEADLSVLIMCH